MRDHVFKLVSRCQCSVCYNPTDIRFLGSDAGYDLFLYWVKQCKLDKILKSNSLYFIKYSNDCTFKKVCHACYINRRITYKHIRQSRLTGKLPHPIERSQSRECIDDLWNTFKDAAKNIKWFIGAYADLKVLEPVGKYMVHVHERYIQILLRRVGHLRPRRL